MTGSAHGGSGERRAVEAQSSADAADALSGQLPSWWDAQIVPLRQRAWREYRFFFLIVGAHILAGVVFDWAGWANVIRPRTWAPRLFLFFLGMTAVGAPFALLHHRLGVRDESGRRVVGRPGWQIASWRFRSAHLSGDGLIALGVVPLGVAVVTAIHDGWKGTIRDLHGFEWDRTLWSIDAALHGGAQPWALLHRWFGSASATLLLDRSYWLWYPVLVGVAVWQAWTTDPILRRRFMIAFALVWVVEGTVVAHLAASLGPCFVGLHSTDPTPFDPQMRFLADFHASHPLVAVEMQRRLWQAHSAGYTDYWMSISAMPSLHVAMVTLFAFVATRASVPLGAALSGFAAVTLVGSVHLGWHYAIDGYVAIALTFALYALASQLAKIEA